MTNVPLVDAQSQAEPASRQLPEEEIDFAELLAKALGAQRMPKEPSRTRPAAQDSGEAKEESDADPNAEAEVSGIGMPVMTILPVILPIRGSELQEGLDETGLQRTNAAGVGTLPGSRLAMDPVFTQDSGEIDVFPLGQPQAEMGVAAQQLFRVPNAAPEQQIDQERAVLGNASSEELPPEVQLPLEPVDLRSQPQPQAVPQTQTAENAVDAEIANVDLASSGGQSEAVPREALRTRARQPERPEAKAEPQVELEKPVHAMDSERFSSPETTRMVPESSSKRGSAETPDIRLESPGQKDREDVPKAEPMEGEPVHDAAEPEFSTATDAAPDLKESELADEAVSAEKGQLRRTSEKEQVQPSKGQAPVERRVQEAGRRAEQPVMPAEPTAVQEQSAETVEKPAPLRSFLDLRQPEQLVSKLVRTMESLVTEERTEVRIELKPEHLGEMRIKLSMERGIMVAEFMVQDRRVQELISAQLPQLYSALQERGTVLADVMIDIGLGQEGAAQRDQHQSRSPGRGGQMRTQPESRTVGRYTSGTSWNRVDVRV